jgi:hypothetical protein
MQSADNQRAVRLLLAPLLSWTTGGHLLAQVTPTHPQKLLQRSRHQLHCCLRTQLHRVAQLPPVRLKLEGSAAVLLTPSYQSVATQPVQRTAVWQHCTPVPRPSQSLQRQQRQLLLAGWTCLRRLRRCANQFPHRHHPDAQRQLQLHRCGYCLTCLAAPQPYGQVERRQAQLVRLPAQQAALSQGQRSHRWLPRLQVASVVTSAMVRARAGATLRGCAPGSASRAA